MKFRNDILTAFVFAICSALSTSAYNQRATTLTDTLQSDIYYLQGHSILISETTPYITVTNKSDSTEYAVNQMITPPPKNRFFIGINTNLLHWATATPNLGIDIGLSRHFSISLSLGYNAFNFPNRLTQDNFDTNPKLHHWLAAAEWRFWPNHSFRGLYLSTRILGGQYNIGGLSWPQFLKDARYEGWAAGLGLSVGFRLPLAGGWGIGAAVGAGLVHLNYKNYECGCCGKARYTAARNLILPTDASITLSYIFGNKDRKNIQKESPVYEHNRVTTDGLIPFSQPETTDAIEETLGELLTDTASFVIRYPLDRSEYRPDFADNAAEMERVYALIDSVELSGGEINEIRITGYASPEYDAGHNRVLSENRAISTAGALVAAGLPNYAIITVTGAGDDWEGLRRAVPHLNISGDDYRKLRAHRATLVQVYPTLRRTVIDIIFTIRP